MLQLGMSGNHGKMCSAGIMEKMDERKRRHAYAVFNGGFAFAAKKKDQTTDLFTDMFSAVTTMIDVVPKHALLLYLTFFSWLSKLCGKQLFFTPTISPIKIGTIILISK